MRKRHIIIGASAAGIGAASSVARCDSDAELICITREAVLPYNTCFLADLLAGTKTESEIALPLAHIFNVPHRQLLTGVTVTQIDRAGKQIICSDGALYAYDTLFIGTGYKPRLLPQKNGTDLVGYFSYYYADDITRIHTFIMAHAPRTALIIGGGINGLECADALCKRGIAVTVVVRSEQVLYGLVSAQAAAFIEEKMAQQGVFVHRNAQLATIVERDGNVVGVTCADGTHLQADMVISSIGSEAQTQLAADAGLALSDGAVVVDDYLQTSDPSIWAGGDCARVYDIFTAMWRANTLWQEAMRQGVVAGKNMAGQLQSYDGAYQMLESTIFGIPIAHAGKQYADSCITTVSDTSYKKLVIKDGKLAGFTVIGLPGAAVQLKRALMMRLAIDQLV